MKKRTEIGLGVIALSYFIHLQMQILPTWLEGGGYGRVGVDTNCIIWSNIAMLSLIILVLSAIGIPLKRSQRATKIVKKNVNIKKILQIGIVLFCLCALAPSIAVAAEYEWHSNTTIISGLTYAGLHSSPDVFQKDGVWYLISIVNHGVISGYNWTGSTWQSDTNIINGLSASGHRGRSAVFNKSGIWYSIVGKSFGTFNGFNWSGSQWQVDSDINSGLGDIGGLSTPTVFQKDGTWYLISGSSSALGDGLFHGYNWTGSTWQSDTDIVSGLVNNGDDSTPDVFQKDGVWYLISGVVGGAFHGYNWTGSTWQSDTAITNGLGDVGSSAAPSVFQKDSVWYLISGNYSGLFNGFDWLCGITPADPTNLTNTAGDCWVNYTWEAGSGNITDSYNILVSIDGSETWDNETTTIFKNIPASNNTWANISIWAWNSTTPGCLSDNYISQSVKINCSKPYNPSPADDAINQLTNVTLSWDYGDSDATYDVYFEKGTTPPTILVSDDQSEKTFVPGTLDNESTYYWKIIAKDGYGVETEGHIWSFTTQEGNCSGYSLTIKARDIEDDSVLNVFVAELSTGEQRDTIYGETTFDCLDTGYYTVTVTASRYQSRQESIVVDQNKTVIVYLAPITEADYFLPKTKSVTFTVQNVWGTTKFEDVHVEAVGYNITHPEGWLGSYYGFDNTTEIYDTTQSGTTDSEGQIAFVMVDTIKYKVTFVKEDAGINKTWFKYPTRDEYTIIVWAWEYPDDGTEEMLETTLNITTSTINDTHASIHVNYTDPSNLTSSININITRLTSFNHEEVVWDYTVTNQSIVNESFVVTPYQGRSFTVKVTALHEEWGEKIWEYGIKFKGLLSDLELPEKIYPIIAIALIFFIGGFFGASTALQGSLVVSIVGWILYGIGWLSLGSDAVMISALSLATVMSVLGLLMDRGRKAGVQ